jgi:type IV secretion system protein VirB9
MKLPSPVLLILAFLSLATSLWPQNNMEARTVKYGPKDIVRVHARLRFTTLIILPENERILDFVVGDKDMWVVEGTQNFCYVKPSKEGISTDITLITAAGNVYSFYVSEVGPGPSEPPDLKIFVEPTDEKMLQSLSASPRFVPAGEVDDMKAAVKVAQDQAQESTDRFQADYPVRDIKFDYNFERNKKPFLVSAIYHDGKFTYIRSAGQEKPTLYEVKDGAPNLVNFDLKDGVYIVGKVIDKGYLAIGKHKMDFERRSDQ